MSHCTVMLLAPVVPDTGMIAPLATAKSVVTQLITLARGAVPPAGYTRRSPKSVGDTTVMLKATALAVPGTPQVPTPRTGKLRLVFASRNGPPVGPGGLRVSITRHGVRVKKLYGPVCACAGTAAASIATPARITRLVFVMVNLLTLLLAVALLEVSIDIEQEVRRPRGPHRHIALYRHAAGRSGAQGDDRVVGPHVLDREVDRAGQGGGAALRIEPQVAGVGLLHHGERDGHRGRVRGDAADALDREGAAGVGGQGRPAGRSGRVARVRHAA